MAEEGHDSANCIINTACKPGLKIDLQLGGAIRTECGRPQLCQLLVQQRTASFVTFHCAVEINQASANSHTTTATPRNVRKEMSVVLTSHHSAQPDVNAKCALLSKHDTRDGIGDETRKYFQLYTNCLRYLFSLMRYSTSKI